MFSKGYYAYTFPAFKSIDMSTLKYWISIYDKRNLKIPNKKNICEYSPNIFFTPNNSIFKKLIKSNQ